MKIKKGDMVQVRTGKDRGKRGEVMRAIPKTDKVIVDGVNQVKKHQRATRATMQGGIIDKDMPLPVANVSIVCPSCGPTRIGYRFDGADGKQDRATKKRICRKCGGEL
ncbi:MAG TPA: 50S ribosomal protein L24 [Acidimicrobiales bacterium]|nr:50S ribosomal protein L24 [Acidimicrobiales bacterium]